jgi:hypothetical protein
VPVFIAAGRWGLLAGGALVPGAAVPGRSAVQGGARRAAWRSRSPLVEPAGRAEPSIPVGSGDGPATPDAECLGCSGSASGGDSAIATAIAAATAAVLRAGRRSRA